MLGFGRSPGERARSAGLWGKIKQQQAKREHERAQKSAESTALMHHLAQEQYARANQIYERYFTETVHYANVIILLGYGGFFALWSAMAGKMPRGLFGTAGLLMGISLLIFLLFEIAKIAAGSWALTSAKKRGLDENEVLGYLSHSQEKVDRWWLWAFIPSLLCGLTAGGILLWAYWMAATHGPWG